MARLAVRGFAPFAALDPFSRGPGAESVGPEVVPSRGRAGGYLRGPRRVLAGSIARSSVARTLLARTLLARAFQPVRDDPGHRIADASWLAEAHLGLLRVRVDVDLGLGELDVDDADGIVTRPKPVSERERHRASDRVVDDGAPVDQ